MRATILLSSVLVGGLPFALSFACSGAQPAPATSASTRPSEPPPRSPHAHGGQDRTLHMQTHFWAAIDARDAVIGADVESARHSLRWLADHPRPESIPSPSPDLDAMRAAARAAAQAPDAEGVALGVARLAARCGACHTAMGAKIEPLEEVDDQGFAPEGPEYMEDRMGRHAWSVDELWSGLVFPSEQAWTRGVAVLQKLPADPPVDGEASISDATRQALEGIRALAGRAEAAKDPEARARVVGELLLSCEGCHAR